jgi:hypothetical protein
LERKIDKLEKRGRIELSDALGQMVRGMARGMVTRANGKVGCADYHGTSPGHCFIYI